MGWREGIFREDAQTVNGVRIHFRHGGQGSPLLLLHGYPQTHAAWRKVAPLLASRFHLVMPDLRGYGDSSKPGVDVDPRSYTKRTMACDMACLMHELGHASFHLCGHDRGGRVAHRLARDFSTRVRRLMVIDIAPTVAMYDRTNMQFAMRYYHWFFLTQPSPLPETLIASNARFYLHSLLGVRPDGTHPFMESWALDEYERCFVDPHAIRASCEDYRASASIDLGDDRMDPRRIDCPTSVLWGERGLVGEMFAPLDLWQAECGLPVTGQGLPAGHYIPDEIPGVLAERIADFFR